MKHRGICAVLLSATLLTSALPAALAEEAMPPLIMSETEQDQTAKIDRMLSYGTVTALTMADGVLQSLTVSNEQQGEVVYLVDENTLYLDSGAALPAQAGDVTEGAQVYLYHREAMTLSLPAQTYAEAVVLNVPQDAACARLHTVESVRSQPNDGTLAIQTDGGSLILTVQQDAAVTPWLTKNAVSLDDLTVGTRFFAWYDVVLESYPAQAYTDRVLLTPAAAIADDAVQAFNAPEDGAALSIVVDGDMVLPDKALAENGTVLVPVRATAETLGCTVSWNQATRTATIANEARQMTLTPGDDLYLSAATQQSGLVGMTAPISLGAAPRIDAQGRMWASAELFEVLQGYTVEIDQTSVSITPQ